MAQRRGELDHLVILPLDQIPIDRARQDRRKFGEILPHLGARQVELLSADPLSPQIPNYLLLLNQFLDEERRLSPVELMVMVQVVGSWWVKEALRACRS
jgi:hypothetical protein